MAETQVGEFERVNNIPTEHYGISTDFRVVFFSENSAGVIQTVVSYLALEFKSYCVLFVVQHHLCVH